MLDDPDVLRSDSRGDTNKQKQQHDDDEDDSLDPHKIKMMDLLLTNCDCVPAPVISIYTMSPGRPSCSIVARIYLVRSPDITR